MLRARGSFSYAYFDDAGISHVDEYEDGSHWITVGYREDWRRVARVDGQRLHEERWLPESMLDNFDAV